MDMERGEERVRCMERVIWKHITICKIHSQQEFAVWLRKLKQGALYQPRRVDGEGEEREVQKGGDIYIPMADSC